MQILRLHTAIVPKPPVEVPWGTRANSLWCCRIVYILRDPWDFPGNSTGVGCHFLLQGVFATQGSNPHLLHWQVESLPWSHQRSPNSMVLALKREISMEQDTKPRHKPTHLWTINLWQRRQEYTMENTVSSISDSGKNGQLHVKEWNWNMLWYHTQK